MMARMPLPVTFRYVLIENLMRSIEAGESLAVVGAASVGKSNVVHALQQPNIQAAHLIKQASAHLMVWVDSNDLVELTPWHFFELLLYRLAVHAHKQDLDSEIVSRLEAMHEKLLERDNPTLAQRHFEEAIRWLCQTHRLKVVLLLDEFDLLFQELPERLFINLRSLRDKNKYTLVYLLFTRQILANLRPDLSQVEAFAELFQAKTYYLRPYDLAGTEMMLDRLSERQRITWPSDYTLTIFELAGGHSGLTKIIFNKILPDLQDKKPVDSEALAGDPDIIAEGQKIWDSLTGPERSLLQQVVRPGFPQGVPEPLLATAEQLQDKGLLRFDYRTPRPFALLFTRFIEQTFSEEGEQPEFVFDRQTQTCRINNQEIILPTLPAKLLALLSETPGQPCRRAAILDHLYPDEDHSHLNRLSDDPRLYDVVKNLRKKIEPNPHTPRYVKTVRGVGFKLDI